MMMRDLTFMDGVRFAIIGVLLEFGVLGAGAPSCGQIAAKTALDVVSCSEAKIANSAGPLLGDVAGIVLSGNTDAEASGALEGLAIAKGIDVVICAIDTVIKALGDQLSAPHGSAPTPHMRALSKARNGRDAVMALKTKASVVP